MAVDHKEVALRTLIELLISQKSLGTGRLTRSICISRFEQLEWAESVESIEDDVMQRQGPGKL